MTSPTSAVTLERVLVGGQDNAVETTHLHDVADVYGTSRSEVANAPYTEFQKALAASGPSELCDASMALPASGTPGGSARGGGFKITPSLVSVSTRSSRLPSSDGCKAGLRIASVPEHGTIRLP